MYNIHKLSFIAFSLTLSNICFCQTYDKELENFSIRYKNGLITPTQYKQMAKDWRELIDSFGGYPELPYNNSTSKVEYHFVQDFQGIEKSVIYERIMEWGALTFGSLKSVLHYSDIESGKIILKGNFDIRVRKDFKTLWGNKKETVDSKNCTQTYILTIKNSKLKIEIIDLVYEYSIAGYALGTTYIPTRTIKYSLDMLYPISNDIPINWKSDLDMLKQTTIKIDLIVQSLNAYIGNYKHDYEF